MEREEGKRVGRMKGKKKSAETSCKGERLSATSKEQFHFGLHESLEPLSRIFNSQKYMVKARTTEYRGAIFHTTTTLTGGQVKCHSEEFSANSPQHWEGRVQRSLLR